MKNDKFYRCPICGNVIEMTEPSGVIPVCCGRSMLPLVPGSVDASAEKHVPVCSLNGNRFVVRVGSELHPSEPGHYISWVVLATSRGEQMVRLGPGKDPVAEFSLSGEKPLEVYAYCNIHGLWGVDI